MFIYIKGYDFVKIVIKQIGKKKECVAYLKLRFSMAMLDSRKLFNLLEALADFGKSRKLQNYVNNKLSKPGIYVKLFV